MHAILTYRGNRPTHKQTHKHTHIQDWLQYTVLKLASAQCSYTDLILWCYCHRKAPPRCFENWQIKLQLTQNAMLLSDKNINKQRTQLKPHNAFVQIQWRGWPKNTFSACFSMTASSGPTPVSEMTYTTVSSGMLNPSIPYHLVQPRLWYMIISLI